jgi:hypothetical protein
MVLLFVLLARSAMTNDHSSLHRYLNVVLDRMLKHLLRALIPRVVSPHVVLKHLLRALIPRVVSPLHHIRTIYSVRQLDIVQSAQSRYTLLYLDSPI